MRRLFTILSAISLVLGVVTAICWALSATGYERAFITARWQDHGTSIDLHFSASGWRESRLINGDLDYLWRADAAHSLDSTRQLLRQEFGPPNQATRHWSPMPEIQFAAIGKGWSATQTVDLYDGSLWEMTFAYAMLPLIWLALHIYRWRRTKTDPAAIKCGACGYDMRATPDRCPECGSLRGNSATKVREWKLARRERTHFYGAPNVTRPMAQHCDKIIYSNCLRRKNGKM